jgi:hypothetical protein
MKTARQGTIKLDEVLFPDEVSVPPSRQPPAVHWLTLQFERKWPAGARDEVVYDEPRQLENTGKSISSRSHSSYHSHIIGRLTGNHGATVYKPPKGERTNPAMGSFMAAGVQEATRSHALHIPATLG